MLSVIVPCYNEEANLPGIFKEFSSSFANIKDVEILLVNNGSTDNSSTIFNQLLKEYNNDKIKVINVSVNEGYGNGILAGLDQAAGEVLSWTHADLQTDPKDVLIAYQLFQKHGSTKIFVKGKREKRGFVYDFFTWSMQVCASIALNTKLDDIGAQPKLFSREFYNSYLKNKAPKDFSLDLYALYWAVKSGRVIDFPVIMKDRQFGEAKGGGSWKTRLKVSRRTLNFIFKMRSEIS